MAVRPVQVKGLAELRRDLRRVDKEAVKEIRATIRDAARIVAEEASSSVSHRTGTLAGSYRATTSGTKGIVRSPVPYARFIEYGFHPRGGPTFVEGQRPIEQAIEREQDAVIDALGDGIDKAARSAGWH